MVGVVEAVRPVATDLDACDPLSLAGLRAILTADPGIRVVPQASEAEVSVTVEATLDEDAAIRLKELRRGHGLRAVLVLDTVDAAGMDRCADLGVSGLLVRRDTSAEDLRHAVLSAAQDEAVKAPALLARLLRAVAQRTQAAASRPPRPTDLSDRERAVVELLAEGLDTVDVADRLGYSPRTIKNTLQGVMLRYDLCNRTHVVAYAIREGLI